jgi:hypothetical protein
MRAVTAIASFLLVGTAVGLQNPHDKAKAVQRAHQHKTSPSLSPRSLSVARDDYYRHLDNETASQ